MKHIKLQLLATTILSLAIALPALAQECATEPVVVGLLPKLDTDPYLFHPG